MPVSLNNTQVVFNDATTQTTSGVTVVNVGTGISSTGGKTPTLTNTGVTSVNGSSGAVTIATGGIGIRGQVFNTNGTFTIPTGITAIKVSLMSGGGGGAGLNNSCGCNANVTNGNAGGASSIASGNQSISAMTANGGAGHTQNTGAVGSVSGQVIAGSSISTLNANAGSLEFSQGGASPFGGFGARGASGIQFYTGLTPGATLTVTRGAAGNGGGGVQPGGVGGPGIVLIEF